MGVTLNKSPLSPFATGVFAGGPLGYYVRSAQSVVTHYATHGEALTFARTLTNTNGSN